MCVCAAPLCAGTVNVSTEDLVTLQSGDTLTYSISAYSYLVHAGELGGPADPSGFTFSLLTEPMTGSLDLGVSLESYGGGVSTPVTDSIQAAGYVGGSLYQGPVTEEVGSLRLSPGLSSELFAGPAVLLTVQNLGGEVTLGLPPYTILESLEVSLSGADFSLGGVVAAATLEQAGASQMSFAEEPFEEALTPEPSSAALFALGALVLFFAARFRRRGRRRFLLSK